MNDLSQQSPVLQATDVRKCFYQGETQVPVLNGVDLELSPGERVAIIGRSGSGKSSLLHILAGLDTADKGRVSVVGEDMGEANGEQRAALRCAYMGFVYQQHHLLPEFSALENVALPQRLNRVFKVDADVASREILEAVGLGHRLQHLPSALSGGERQRVAVARALAHQPRIVLADEPTGNLDQASAVQLMDLMVALSEVNGTAFLVVTHDVSMLHRFHRVLTLSEGRIEPYAADA
ncbi:MAG: ABC transporter ATP-binding protein [Pseudomonadales bacterium]|jgi:lipoprotein-releasing system ATP-binding protein|nr:ABC transporter ATP-binding protein [Pseudomonadales bacterium]